MPVEIQCDTCESVFEVQPYRADSARFCSHDCRAKWQSDAYKGEKAPNYQGKKQEYECRNCGKEYEQYPSQSGTEFCSKDCYTDWQQHKEPLGITFDEDGYPRIASNEGVVVLQRLLATLLVDDVSELKGKHIHHKDIPIWQGRQDKVNVGVTYLENLEVLSPAEHNKRHSENDQIGRRD